MPRPKLLATLALGLTLALPSGRGDELQVVRARVSQDAVRWLLLAQNRDGSWGDNPRSPGDVSNTSIAIMALLSTGNTVSRGPHWRALRRAVDWLAKRTADGNGNYDTSTLVQMKLGQNIDLYLAATAYAQLLGTQMEAETEALFHKRATAMAARIAKLQKPNGEWESSYEPILTTISAWLALRQAHDAGVSVGDAAPEKVVRYLEQDCFDGASGVFRDKKWGNQMRFVTQAGALRVLYAQGRERDANVDKATARLLEMRFDQDVGGHAGGEEFLGALFATQAMAMAEPKQFQLWYAKIVTALAKCQNRDGSWLGHHCITGRVFCTACSVIALETPAELLMMARR